MTPAEIAKKRLDEAGLEELDSVRIRDLDESKPTVLPATWSPESVRSAISRFINAVENHNYPDVEDLEVVSMLMDRVLQVDMDNIRNRRGDIPKALGLVHKPHRDYDRRVLAIAFHRTVIELWDNEIVNEINKIGGKRITEEDAIVLGIKAFLEAGIAEFTLDEADSLYELGSSI